MPTITTTTNSTFRNEDITYRNTRKQSEILNEMDDDERKEQELPVPVSKTPEQIQKFLELKSVNCSSIEESKIYMLLSSWISELQELRSENVSLRLKLERIENRRKEEEETEEKAEEEYND